MDAINVITLSIPVFLLLILVEILVSSLKNKFYYRVNDGINNLTAGILQQCYGFLPKAISAVMFAYCFDSVGYFKDTLSYQNGWAWVLAFVLIDFVYYWFHRASHRVAVLWGGHVVHHQSEEYNLTVALRQSILQSVFGAPLIGIYGLLGFDYRIIVVMGGLNTISQFWIHTRLIGKLPKWFEAIFNTPSHHRVHHGRNIQYIDKNYAGAFIIWDKIFGTFVPECDPVVYGITAPTSTWNPLSDQFSTIFETLDKASRRGLLNGLKTLVMPPGWSPETGESVEFLPRSKYDPPMSPRKKVLSVIIFLLATAAVAFYLFNGNRMSFEARVIFVAAATLILTLIGRNMDT